MTDNSSLLIYSLTKPSAYPHPVENIRVIETHISWVILTGKFAYKIKKSVKFKFLDFTSLDKRRQFCYRELDLNRRLAPDYYLDIVAIAGDIDSPRIEKDNQQSDTIEYAVKMKQFPQKNQLDRLLINNDVTDCQIDQLAEKIAKFHETTKKCEPNLAFGSAEHISRNSNDVYKLTLANIIDDKYKKRVTKLSEWTTQSFKQLEHTFTSRKNKGFIRECHGDLHLANIAIVSQQVVIFDCIEFSDELLWNDVMSEIAFVIMDLDQHQRAELGFRFLNRYLEITGDYDGIKILRYYLVYRAMVRCMVSCIQLKETKFGKAELQKVTLDFERYLSLAERYIKHFDNRLIITLGYSGSGKTTISQKLLGHLPAIRIRSDVERKRLLGLPETHRADKTERDFIYSHHMNESTYKYLATLTYELLDSSYNIIVDAAFLQQERRLQFLELAKLRNKPFIILYCKTDEKILVNRLEKRKFKNRDASDANRNVLQKQLANPINFDTKELPFLVTVDTQADIDIPELYHRILKINWSFD